MAYFRCSTGSASSGDGVALVVTCDQNFAGSVITATNGTDTFTETCPSVSPYTVRFEGIPTGTYTISGVSQGQTFTTQFTVLDYETTLNAIPEGATVTPVNDIQTWLHCADIWDKNYTTIAQVLADASTLQALIASNNAADYMARSTTWASSVTANANAMTYIGANNYCANKLLSNSTWSTAICNSAYFESVLNVKVPTMTSNTTPYGEVIYSSTLSSTDYPAWKAFDGSDSTSWRTTDNATNNYVGYVFTNRVDVKKIKCVINLAKSGATGGTIPSHTWKIQARDTNSGSWEDIGTFTTPSITATRTDTYTVNVTGTAKLQYRLFCADVLRNTIGTVGVNSLQFYGRA